MDNSKDIFNIVFLGLARNVSTTINSFMESCYKLSDTGLNVCVIIGENGSIDDTRKILKNYDPSKIKFLYINTDFLNLYKNRIIRLTHGREFLKNYLKENNIISNYISVVDLDEVIKDGINVKQYLKALEILKKNKKNFFAISSKSKPYYYDMLPLKIIDYYEFDIYKIQRTFKFFNFYKNRKKYIYDFQKKISKMRDISTLSSHNGLTTYYYNDYMSGSYLDSKNEPIKSEHINLNLSIHKKTKKFVLMTNTICLKTPPEHMPLNFSQFLKNNFSKLIKFFKL